MLKVGNKKAVNNLAFKSFCANKMRNIIAVIAIALTTMLFSSVFTMGIGTVESLQRSIMRQAGGDGHAVLKYIDAEQFDRVKDHSSIQRIAFEMALSDDVANPELRKRRAEFWYSDEVGLELGFIEPQIGHVPIAVDEVIADTKTLELLGIPLELGAPVTLLLDIRGEVISRDFILCGWWESDPVFNIGQIFTSHAYVQEHREELTNTHAEDQSLAGSVFAYIMFENSTNLEQKLATVLQQSGYSQVEGDDNYIESNVNWSYLSTNFGMDSGTYIGLGCGLLLIIITGYLIIYNIFQISVVRDIRFYGLLKTIGTTSSQLRRILRRQALVLSVFGIPIGLVLGFFCGKAFIPLLMDNSSYAGSAISVSPNPWIFIGASLFALGTVLISTFKPARMAGKVSPVEALRYADRDNPRQQHKSTVNGARIWRMALSNVGRNKLRSILVVVSLSLSIVLLNTVITLSDSIDMDMFVSKFSDSDFLIAHADYFNNKFYGTENQVPDAVIQNLEDLEGFETGGRLYGGRQNMFFLDSDETVLGPNKNEYGHYFSALYGLDQFPMQRLQLIDGEIDMDMLASGGYILEGVNLDDNGKVLTETANFKVGDTVTMHNWRVSAEGQREYQAYEFTVMGHVAIKTYLNSDRMYWGNVFYLPSQAYMPLVDEPAVMSYAMNVQDVHEEMVDVILKEYTETIEPMMNYESKGTTVEAFEGMRQTVLFVGGMLGGIIGLIGILNFINTILTSIIARKKEFAMMQSIGMTRFQLRKMLCYEGLYYAVLTGVCSFVLGLGVSFVVVGAICRQMWFLNFHLITWPLLVSLPILVIIGIVTPLAIYAVADKESIVEQLREVSM